MNQLMIKIRETHPGLSTAVCGRATDSDCMYPVRYKLTGFHLTVSLGRVTFCCQATLRCGS